MVSVCFYFQVHQPFRLKRYSVFDIGNHIGYFDSAKNMEILKKIVSKCYIPANRLMLELIAKTDGKFKVSYSITGMGIEQLEEHAPEVIDSFRQLADTGCVEFLSETYNHSLAFLYSREEFKEQIELHRKKIYGLFGQSPKIFRNTELIYSNDIADFAEKMGYSGILAEGADHILGWRSPNYVYSPRNSAKIKLLLKNYRLSDDVAFRFSEKSWSEFPLTAPKYASWINAINGNGNVVNLFMDYETFGEHQWEDRGIFEFLRHLPGSILKNPDNDFSMPSEIISRYEPVGDIDVPYAMSWADIERDLSAWTGNKMQQHAIKEIYLLEPSVKKTNNYELINEWRRLQTSDHFYYMCTKFFNDGDVHKYFNPYNSPYDAFITFMNILNDFKIKIKKFSDISSETFFSKEVEVWEKGN